MVRGNAVAREKDLDGYGVQQQTYMEVEGYERPAELPLRSWLLSSLGIYDVLAKREEQILAPGMQASRYILMLIALPHVPHGKEPVSTGPNGCERKSATTLWELEYHHLWG